MPSPGVAGVAAAGVAPGESLERVCEALEERGLRLGDAAVWHIGRRLAGELARAHGATDEEGMPAPVPHLRLCPARVRVAADGEVELVWPARARDGREEARGAGGGAEEEREDAIELMAPEQRGGGRVTHRADVYRLGLLLWSLLSGRRPPGDGGRLPSIGSLRPDLPGDLAAAIDAAIEPSAARRTITMVEIEQWLEPMDRGDAGRRSLGEHVRLIQEDIPSGGGGVVEEPPSALPSPLPEPLPSPLPEPLPSPLPEPLPSPSPSPSPLPELLPAPDPAPLVRLEPGSRRLSPLQSIGVAAVTAALVIAIGTYIGDRAVRGDPILPSMTSRDP